VTQNSGGPAKDRRPADPPPAKTADHPQSRVADDADGEREHLDDPEHFARSAALVIAAAHRAASERERGER
jgi:hypothetical protein